MVKVLALLMPLSISLFSEEISFNKSNVHFTKDVPEQTINIFYSIAIDEYKYSNFGFSRDIFTAILQHNDNHPTANFFLGKIYEEVAFFKNVELAQQCYIKSATNKEVSNEYRQLSYLSLIRLTNNTELAIKYAQSSTKIESSNLAKQGMVLAYHKKYEKTGDETMLTKADELTKQMNQRFFDGSLLDSPTQQVNLVKP